MKRYITLLPLLAVLGFAMPRSASAITLDVNTEQDTNDGDCNDGTCSIRDAILVSNETLPQGDTFNTINIPAGHYLITQPNAAGSAGPSGDFDILNHDVVIRGAGADLTIIDANGLDRIFDIPDPLNVTLEGLSLTGGNVGGDLGENGGAIRYGASVGFVLTIDGCEISQNNAFDGGGVYAVSDNGNVINMEGKILFTRSTLAGNTAENQGGALSAHDMHIDMVNSTFSGNSAVADGGAILLQADHEQIDVVLRIRNSTIFDNQSTTQGGGIALYESVGIGFVNIANSILYGNTAVTGPNCSMSNNIVSNSFFFNIFGDLTGCALDPSASDNTTDDPQLEPLADNGGPTRTHALPAESVAIDGGNPQGCFDIDTDIDLVKDQRGQDRPMAACDVGAYELGSADLQIGKTADLDSAEVGDDITYTIEIRNDSPGIAFGVTVTDALPVGLSFKSVTPAENCSHSNGVVTCEFDQLAFGENEIITLVTIATQDGVIINSASVAGAEGEVNPDDNQSSDDVIVGDVNAICGNGQLEPGEACEDGNLNDGDGCNSLCEFEGFSGGCDCNFGGSAQSPALGGSLLAALATLAAFAARRRLKRS